MSCTSPSCYLVPFSGGRPRRFMEDWPAGSYPGFGRVVYLPCGHCIACRRERRQELTILQCCEAQLSEYDNWFLTLTYDDWKTIQLTGCDPYSLNRKHLSTFCESMRKYLRYHGLDFRFFAAGEYGSLFSRPHYHLSLFNIPPSLLGIDDFDTSFRLDYLQRGRLINVSGVKRDENGNFYWQSPVISDRWPFGNHQIYLANRKTYQYVAGYVVKKLSGDRLRDQKSLGLLPEFQCQSRPSIGWPWFLRYFGTISNIDGDKLVNDLVSVHGISWKCPRIFTKWLSSLDHFDGSLVAQRLARLRQLSCDPIPDRDDLARRSRFDQYSADHYKQNNTHKEL